MPEAQHDTITGSIIDGTTGTGVSDIKAMVTTEDNGSITICMKASETVVLKGPDGNTTRMGDISKVPGKVYIIRLQGVISSAAEDHIAQVVSTDKANIKRKYAAYVPC